MEYAVDLAARAERDLAELFDEIHADSSQAAVRWYRGLKKAILSLESMPNRCASIVEDPQLRHLLYGRGRGVYRIIYRVLEAERRVEVLHIRHGSRDRMTNEDLK